MHLLKHYTSHQSKQYALLFLLLNLSACSMTPKLLSIANSVEQVEAQKQRDALEAHMQEWNTLKPRLTEIVKLESELRYLIEQIGGLSLSPADSLSLRSPEDNKYSDPKFSMSKALEAALDLSIEQAKEFADNEDTDLVETMDVDVDSSLQAILEMQSESTRDANLKAALNKETEASLDVALKDAFIKESTMNTAINKQKDLYAKEQHTELSNLNLTTDAKFLGDESAQDASIFGVNRGYLLAGAVTDRDAPKYERASLSDMVSDEQEEANIYQHDAKPNNVELDVAAPIMVSKFVDTADKFRKAGSEASKMPVSDNNGTDKFRVVGIPSEGDASIGTPNALNNNNLKNEQCYPPSKLETGGVGVHLVSYSTLNSAKKGWASLLKNHPNLLCDKRAVVKEVEVNNKRFFSVRVGPLKTQAEAISLCKGFIDKGQYCKQTEFDGAFFQ